jgi:hypothetical protein
VQWFVMMLVNAVAAVITHGVLVRRPKNAQEPVSIPLMPVPAADAAMQTAADLRIARIISEIPQRRVRRPQAGCRS